MLAWQITTTGRSFGNSWGRVSIQSEDRLSGKCSTSAGNGANSSSWSSLTSTQIGREEESLNQRCRSFAEIGVGVGWFIVKWLASMWVSFISFHFDRHWYGWSCIAIWCNAITINLPYQGLPQRPWPTLRGNHISVSQSSQRRSYSWHYCAS